MAETLGSLCDKLTIIKLKQGHSEDEMRLNSLAIQEKQLPNEINEFVNAAISGKLPREQLTFTSNKVYKEESNFVPDVTVSIGQVFSQLAEFNCQLWHELEKLIIALWMLQPRETLINTVRILLVQIYRFLVKRSQGP